MIKIEDLNSKKLQPTDLTVKTISNLEKSKINGGRWIENGGCVRFWVN
jgi:hypothetical protein